MDLDPQEGESEKRGTPRQLEIQEQVVLLAQERMGRRGLTRKLVHPWILLGLCVFVTAYIYVLLFLTWKDQVVAIGGTLFVVFFIMGFAFFADYRHDSTKGTSLWGSLFAPRKSKMKFCSDLVAPVPGDD
jgi:Flp pilus assembly protein TadB